MQISGGVIRRCFLILADYTSSTWIILHFIRKSNPIIANYDHNNLFSCVILYNDVINFLPRVKSVPYLLIMRAEVLSGMAFRIYEVDRVACQLRTVLAG